MAVVITGVTGGSPAARKKIKPGDRLVSINGHAVEDVLDYRFYLMDSRLELMLETEKGARRVRLRKAYEEDIGLEFETYLMDKQHACRNKCIFCFIDQMPPGMRESLYFKDDDSRLSFLFGNYITLTNLSEHEVERIISMHISPMNISVHTTNPALRCEMMKNRFAGETLSILGRLAAAGIRINCQLVLCPGVNDGEELTRTMTDLAGLLPAVESVAAVPVGLTRYREGLHPLRPYTAAEAADVIDRMESFGAGLLERTGNRVFYPADEFYLKAGRPIPPVEFYGSLSQLENGVGMVALLRSQFSQALDGCGDTPRGSRMILATGVAAAPLMKAMVDEATKKWHNLQVEVAPIINRIFGETITVAGLVTGGDLIGQLRGKRADILLIPDAMLRHEKDRFLDDVTPQDVERALNVRLEAVPVDGDALVEALLW